MKKLVKFILIGMALAPMSLNAQQDAQSFVERYRKYDGFTLVTIEKPAMKMISFLVQAGKEENVEQFINCLDAVQALRFERGQDKIRSESFTNEALAFCNANRYKVFAEATERDESVKIFCKTEGKTVTDMVILCSEPSHVEMICIKGKIALDDLLVFTGSFGKNIASK